MQANTIGKLASLQHYEIVNESTVFCMIQTTHLTMKDETASCENGHSLSYFGGSFAMGLFLLPNLHAANERDLCNTDWLLKKSN